MLGFTQFKLHSQRKVYVHPNNRYFSGQLSLVSSDNDFSINFDKALCSMNHLDYTYQGDWNTFVLQDRTKSENFITPVWNNWVEEELTYNTTTGEATYKVGDESVTGTCEVLNKDYIKLRIHSYGWFTGHYTKMDYIDIQVMSSTNNTLSLNFVGENYTDGTPVYETFTKEWNFAEDLSTLDLTINILQNSYQNTVTASDFTINGNRLSVVLQPNLSSPLNELVVQFTNSKGNIVKISGSETFWSKTKTNHAPRLADGQIRQLVSATNEPAFIHIDTYDADGDTVTLSIEDDAGGYVGFDPDDATHLFASFSDGNVSHTIKIGLNDGKELVTKEFNVLQFDQTSIDTFYSDVDKNANDYIYDGITFGTLKGVVWGQPDPNDATKRILDQWTMSV